MPTCAKNVLRIFQEIPRSVERSLGAKLAESANEMTKQRRWVCGTSVVLALSSVGCGGRAEQNQTSVPESAGSSGITPASSGGSASSESGGTGSLEVGDTDADKRPNFLVLDAWGGPAGKVSAGVEMTQPGVGPQATCDPPMNEGACQLTACVLGGIGSPSSGYGDFGPISASVGAATETLTYNGVYYLGAAFPESLGTGGIMTFHGGNTAGVPEFNVSAIIPGLGVLTSPLPATDGGTVIVDTSQDLTLTWSPISIGQIRFQVYGGGYNFGNTDALLECSFEGAAGTGVISRTLLSVLKEKAPPGSTSAVLSSELDATTVVGGLTITTHSHQQPAEQVHGFSVTLE